MKRTAAAFVLLAGLGGGMTPDKKSTEPAVQFGKVTKPATNQNMVGPRGEPVVQAGYNPTTEGGVMRADLKSKDMPGGYNGIRRTAGGGIVPVPAMGPYGAVAALGGLPPGLMAPINARTSVRFGDPADMRVTWYGPGGLNDTPLVTPFRYNFAQGGIYRLKLSNIPGRPGVDLYPTLDVVPATPKTATYLAHSSVPVSFTDEDFEQVTAGNFLVKVIYLPDPQYQDLAAVAGPAEVISTRLEPGVDPIAEARRRGEILAVIRLGNIDLDAKGTPPLDAPNPFAGPGGPMPAPLPGGLGPVRPWDRPAPAGVPPTKLPIASAFGSRLSADRSRRHGFDNFGFRSGRGRSREPFPRSPRVNLGLLTLAMTVGQPSTRPSAAALPPAPFLFVSVNAGYADGHLRRRGPRTAPPRRPVGLRPGYPYRLQIETVAGAKNITLYPSVEIRGASCRGWG